MERGKRGETDSPLPSSQYSTRCTLLAWTSWQWLAIGCWKMGQCYFTEGNQGNPMVHVPPSPSLQFIQPSCRGCEGTGVASCDRHHFLERVACPGPTGETYTYYWEWCEFPPHREYTYYLYYSLGGRPREGPTWDPECFPLATWTVPPACPWRLVQTERQIYHWTTPMTYSQLSLRLTTSVDINCTKSSSPSRPIICVSHGSPTR